MVWEREVTQSREPPACKSDTQNSLQFRTQPLKIGETTRLHAPPLTCAVVQGTREG